MTKPVSTYAPNGGNPLEMSNLTIKAVDQISIISSKKILDLADTMEKGAGEIVNESMEEIHRITKAYLDNVHEAATHARDIAAAYQEHAAKLKEQISKYQEKIVTIETTMKNLGDALGGNEAVVEAAETAKVAEDPVPGFLTKGKSK